MLKLTLADWATQSEGEVVYVNHAQIWHVKPAQRGSYVHCGSAMYGHGWWAKESAEEVLRMVDEAKGRRYTIEEMLESLAWSCPDETPAVEFRDHINWLKKSFGIPVDSFGVPVPTRGI